MTPKKSSAFVKALAALAAALTLCSCGMFRPADSPPGKPDATGAGTSAPDVSVSDTSAPDVSTADNSAPDTEAPVTTEPEPEVVTVSFLAVGDNVIHPNIYMEAKKRAVAGGREYNFAPIYEAIAADVAAADVAFINQETIFGGAEKGYSGYPMFNTPSDLGYDLAELSFDVVNIANNHMCDAGTDGLANAVAFWESLAGGGSAASASDAAESAGNTAADAVGAAEGSGNSTASVGDTVEGEVGAASGAVIMIGARRADGSDEPYRIIERSGARIAFLAYTYGTNGVTLRAGSAYRVPYLADADIEGDIAAARAAADMVVVSVHWGDENTYTPNDDQRAYAARMAAAGADVILGHHPHVLQPIERLDRADGASTLCIWSMGNLISAMMYPANMVGGVFYFDATFELRAGKAELRGIDNVRVRPTVFFYGMDWYGTKLYWLDEFTAEKAAAHGTARFGYPCTLDTLRRYAENAVGDYMD